MASIKKKCWPKEFEEVQSGKKNYELRLADFDVQEGDTLILEEWDPEKQDYTGRTVERTVTFVGATWRPNDLAYWPEEEVKKHGLRILSLK